MARDYTKYNVSNVGEKLNKSRLVQAIVKDYIAKNTPNWEALQTAFPNNLQGKKCVVAKKSEVEKEKDFYIDAPFALADGTEIVTCRQWGKDNILNFIAQAKTLGYSVLVDGEAEFAAPLKVEQTKKETSMTTFDITKLSIRDFKKLIRTTEDKKALEASLVKQVKVNIDFWSYLLIYDNMVNDGAMELSAEASDDASNAFTMEWYEFEEEEVSLAQFVLDKLEMDFEEVQTDTEKRILYIASFGSYLYHSFGILVFETSSADLAGFIASNDHTFLRDGEDVFDTHGVGDDWIVTMADEWLMYCGFDTSDYEGDCELRLINGDYREFSINYEEMADAIFAQFE